MQENLVIVESPAKAKTIEKILGPTFLVKSSFGHIRDLEKHGISIDIENGYQPHYVVSDDKKKIVSELSKLAKAATTVYLASDEDREGEAIAWHLSQTLNLDPQKTKRIVFHEITPSAIINAVANPRNVDQNLVDAQQARRILDRLVGFELSPLLWKKVKPSLSAGRVQSVVVKLIVSREREIINFNSTPYGRIVGVFSTTDGQKITAEVKDRFETIDNAREFLGQLVGAHYAVENVVTSPTKRSPAPPFTTSTLQQEAGRKLGFSVLQTMSVAQKLYEAGHITYMRTDSVNLSNMALSAAKEAIGNMFGENYHKFRQYTTKSKGAQEAHEAIRPTHFENQDAGATPQEKRLYQLIWKRTVATQMADAQLEKTTVTIAPSFTPQRFTAMGEVIIFDGFLKLYIESHDDETTEDKEGLLPQVTKGDPLTADKITATEKFTARPPRYSEASLVKQLEELGIGRPSTYAPTISTVITRGYVVKESREGTPREYRLYTLSGTQIKETAKTEITGTEKQKLFPTDIGMVVTDFLEQYFANILNYGFTAGVEEQFDNIAEGNLPWQQMLDQFYKPFHSDVESTGQNSEYARAERELGVDPKTKKMVIARVGRYGPMVQIGDNEDKKYAKLPAGKLIENITLEEALSLFSLPREVGEFEDTMMIVGAGRFGPYVKHNDAFTSLDKDDDPYTVTADRCQELIVAKREKDKNKIISDFPQEKLQVLNGRYGPYIARDGKNYKIPKTTDPATLTLELCMELVTQQDANPSTPKKSFTRYKKK